jgi:ferrochelatase
MRKGILLVNLGTPVSPATGDVRKYLTEFLMDKRVINIHPFLRFILVRGIIVPFRGPGSARLYQKIWNNKTGSPLLHYSTLQQKLLAQSLGSDYVVELAMRYQHPSIASGLAKLRHADVGSIQVISLFPQYASATCGSVFEKVMNIISVWPVVPSLSFANAFYDNPLFIRAFAANARKYLDANYDHVLFSFHGLPEQQVKQCDPSGLHCMKKRNCCDQISAINQNCYAAQCHQTARLIAGELMLNKLDYSISFQSRLGNAEWLKPYTIDRLIRLAKRGKKRILVICPAFVADCLETLYEIGVEYRETFLMAGGEDLQLVENLNDNPLFIQALKNMVLETPTCIMA